MSFLQERSGLSSQNTERIKNNCCCDLPRKAKKTSEDLLADKQLKEIFRRDLKQDIFKFCQNNLGDGKGGKGSKKSIDDKQVKKKRHFLPPLKKGSSRSRKEFRFSDDNRRLRSRYGSGEYEDGRFFRTGDDDGTEGEDDGRYGRDRDGGWDRNRKWNRDRDGDWDRDRDEDWDKYGDRSKYRGKGSRTSSFLSKKRMSDSKKSRGSKDSWGGSKPGASSSDFNSDIDMSTTIGFGDEYEDASEFSHMYSMEMWDKRTNYLLKYYQLKKVAAKLNARDQNAKNMRDTDNNDYVEGYKHGRDEGNKKAFYEPPIYENNIINDFVEDLYDDYVFEDYAAYEESMYSCSYIVPKKRERTKIIYISTNPEQVDELKETYKEVEIKVVKPKQLSEVTLEIIEQKVENYIKIYQRTSLSDKTQPYTEGFMDGFTDGFHQKFIYQPTDPTFNNDEKFYVNEVRKCVKNDEDDTVIDQKALLDRARDLKASLKGIIDFDAYEREIEALKLSKPLTFTKSDFIFFYSYSGKKRKTSKSISKSRNKQHGSRIGRFSDFGQDSNLMSDLPFTRRGKTGNNRAWDYFNRHNIAEIFRYLGTMLCAHKPDDPIDFLINLLEKCLLFRHNEIHYKAPLVFTEKHVESIYSNMDPLNYGYIDGKQYLYGLNLLDITEAADITLVQNTNTVEKNLFLMNANDRLLEKFRTMIAIS